LDLSKNKTLSSKGKEEQLINIQSISETLEVLSKGISFKEEQPSNIEDILETEEVSNKGIVIIYIPIENYHHYNHKIIIII